MKKKGGSSMDENVKEIVLTGGPCGGKTTALSYVSEKLMDQGFRVFIIPEVATKFITGGIHDIGKIAKKEPEKYFEIERQMLLEQISQHKRFREIAGLFPKEKRVIISDRGPMDIKPYMHHSGDFKTIMRQHKFRIHDLRDVFDSVIHLVTAAKGAEKFYTIENNRARRESINEARIADSKTMNAWIGHSHLKIINNPDGHGFDCKMKRVFQVMCQVIGIPVPLEIERKFLLAKIPDFNAGPFKYAKKIFIEQMYLSQRGDKEESRIRKRAQKRSVTYYQTHKLKLAPGVRQETEKIIKPEEYSVLSHLRNPATQIIRKYRYCFIYKFQYFELDVIFQPIPLCLLEIELTEENDHIELPPFLKISKEVTGDSRYENFSIANGSR